MGPSCTTLCLLEGAWRCQQTAPHRYTIFLNKEWLLAMVAMRATLTVGGVTAPSFTKAVLLLVLQATARILSRQPGADKAALRYSTISFRSPDDSTAP